MYKTDENGEFILDENGEKILLEKPAEENTKPEGGEKSEAEKQVKTLQSKIETLNKEVEFYKSEVGRVTHIRDSILDEKRDEQNKYKALKEQLGDLSPEEIKNAIALAQKSEKDRNSELATIISAREKTIREDLVLPLEKDNAELRKANDGLREKLSKNIVENEISQEALKFGAKRIAIRIISSDFSGRVAVDENGDKYYVDRDGIRADSINYESEFIRHRAENPFLYEENAGSTSRSNSGFESGEKVNNPWSKESFNVTKQWEIKEKNPDLAKRLQAEAK